MGLISLPITNRLNSYNFWVNIWDSVFLYKRFFYLFLYLQKFITYWFNERTLKIFFKKNLKQRYTKGWNYNSNFSKDFLNNYIFGKLWVFKYQSWYIIIINIFQLSDKLLDNLSTFSLDSKNHNFIKNIKRKYYFSKYIF